MMLFGCNCATELCNRIVKTVQEVYRTPALPKCGMSLVVGFVLPNNSTHMFRPRRFRHVDGGQDTKNRYSSDASPTTRIPNIAR